MLFLFVEIFINVDAIIYLHLCYKNQVTKIFDGVYCKTQVNTQLLISQEIF